MKTIFHYDPVTGVYLRQGVADESPLEPGIYLVPASATTDAPPPAGAGQVAVFKAGAWSLVADHRGQTYYKPDGERVTITELGAPDPTWTTTPPPPSLAAAQAAKIAELTKKCGDQITGGFASSALGAPHTYPSQLTDQSNMQASVIDSLV